MRYKEVIIISAKAPLKIETILKREIPKCVLYDSSLNTDPKLQKILEMSFDY